MGLELVLEHKDKRADSVSNRPRGGGEYGKGDADLDISPSNERVRAAAVAVCRWFGIHDFSLCVRVGPLVRVALVGGE